MAGDKTKNRITALVRKTGAVLLALGCLAVCAALFMTFWKSDVFPREVRILFMICDGLMGIAILWLLRHYLVYYDRKDS